MSQFAFAEDVVRVEKGEVLEKDGFFLTPLGMAKIQAKQESDKKICEAEKKTEKKIGEAKEKYHKKQVDWYENKFIALEKTPQKKKARVSSEVKFIGGAVLLVFYTAAILAIDDKYDK